MATNARLEFLEHIENRDLSAAEIDFSDRRAQKQFKLVLYPDHTPEEYQAFLDQLNFNYDSGYGTQYLFGEIFYQDGGWAVREEYDGSEGWRDVIIPRPPTR